MAMIALGPNARLSSGAIQAELGRRWPDLPRAKAAKKDDTTFSFRIGALDVIAGLIPAPIPWSDLEGPCATSILWKEAADVLRNHKTHLILTVSGTDDPLERIRLLTQVTAALLTACAEAVGVFWTEATLVIPPRLFVEFATTVLPDGPPLDIWVDFRIGKSKSGKSAGFTKGMESLGHMEFETRDSPEPPGELRKRLHGLAHYVLENGPVIRDGDTVGEDAHERIRVIYGDSSFGLEKKVMRLEYAPAGPRRRRRRRPGKKESRSRMTAYGYVHAIFTLAVTILFGIWLHSAMAGILARPWVRHLVLDIPILIGGFVFLVLSDSILQKTFGLEAFEDRESKRGRA
jgi:hypothetical protein